MAGHRSPGRPRCRSPPGTGRITPRRRSRRTAPTGTSPTTRSPPPSPTTPPRPRASPARSFTRPGPAGAAGPAGTVAGGEGGDPRASSQNDLTAEFLGDYVYTAATRTGAVGVWNDVRRAADCPALDAWRESLRTGTSVAKPAPQHDCPPPFG